MLIDILGCAHGEYPDLERGDLLIVTGDLTMLDTWNEYHEFMDWLQCQKYRKKIFISGNHDQLAHEGAMYWMDDELPMQYLSNSGTTFEGVKIWGTPNTLWFHGINPNCKAFTGTEWALEKEFEKIPKELDILISHGPPYGILDKVSRTGEHVGSHALKNAIVRIKPKLVVFSHIHEAYGQTEIDGVKYINCSIMNEFYESINKPIRIIL